MTKEDQSKLIEALKVIREVCKQYDTCLLCPLGNEDSDCALKSKPPINYIITVDDVWRAVR